MVSETIDWSFLRDVQKKPPNTACTGRLGLGTFFGDCSELWQISVDFSTLGAKEVIREEVFSEYDKGMEFFYLQLVHLNTTIFIADQILKVPLRFFVGPDKTIFFNVVLRNFFDAGLLVITRLATDQGDDLYTLTHFKNRVRELVKPEYASSFDGKLKNTALTNELLIYSREQGIYAMSAWVI